MKSIMDIIDRFKDQKVMVIGDVMLDKYIYGEVDRISPEAPVPVIHAKKDVLVLGGSANVANNIKSAGGKPYLVGVIGNGSARDEFIDIMRQKDIMTEGLVYDDSRRTIQKIRLVAKVQQITRLDYEDEHPLDQDIISGLKNKINQYVPECDIIIISDYNKGTIIPEITEYIHELSEKHKKRVIIDPKPANAASYKKSYLITPNIIEAMQLSGQRIKTREDLIKAGDFLKARFGSNVIITRGEEGISVFEEKENHYDMPTEAVEVYDVSGAGDTVVALIGLSLASGSGIGLAADIANIGAGIVVGKAGTSTVSVDELKQAVEKRDEHIKEKGS